MTRCGPDGETSGWTLHHLPTDASETRDLSGQAPGRLVGLVELWWREARRGGELALGPRAAARKAGRAVPADALSFDPTTAPISRMSLPDLAGAWHLSAEIDMVTGASGVVLSMGGRFAGFVLFLDAGRICFDYRANGLEVYELTGPVLAPGARRVALSLGAAGARLRVDGVDAGRLPIPRRWPGIALRGALQCGRDPGAPVSRRYVAPAPCEAGIAHVEMRSAPGRARPPIFARERMNEI